MEASWSWAWSPTPGRRRVARSGGYVSHPLAWFSLRVFFFLPETAVDRYMSRQVLSLENYT